MHGRGQNLPGRGLILPPISVPGLTWMDPSLRFHFKPEIKPEEGGGGQGGEEATASSHLNGLGATQAVNDEGLGGGG